MAPYIQVFKIFYQVKGLITLLLLLNLQFSAPCNAAYSDTTIQLGIRFHIVSGLPMQKKDVALHSWIQASDIENTVMPEVNRIWQETNITFTLEKIVLTQALNPANKPILIDYIVNAHRDSAGKSDPKRIKKLTKLIDPTHHSDSHINVYLVPYLGETSQGNANRKKLRIFVGLWSDKSSKAQRAPEPVELTEGLNFRKGSLSRTIAHEIGHVLGLKHPDKSNQTQYGLLMGGKLPGFSLTAKEIEIARENANTLEKQAQTLDPVQAK